jgi:hypothetical protein
LFTLTEAALEEFAGENRIVKAPKASYVILLLLVLLPFSVFSQPPSKLDKSGKEAQLPSANIPEKYR